MKEYRIEGVPYISQYTHSEKERASRACGIACLAMALAYFTGREHTVSDLYAEGEDISGYIPGTGWKHASLSVLAHNYGILSYAEEFRSLDAKTGRTETYAETMSRAHHNKILHNIKNKVLTIVSIHRTDDTNSHLILLTGVDTDGTGTPISWYVHDPESKDNAPRAYEKRAHGDFINSLRPFIVVFYSG